MRFAQFTLASNGSRFAIAPKEVQSVGGQEVYSGNICCQIVTQDDGIYRVHGATTDVVETLEKATRFDIHDQIAALIGAERVELFVSKLIVDLAMAIKSKPPTRPDPGLVNHVIVCDIGEDDADVRCYNERGDRLPMRLTPGPELNMANSLLRSLQGWQSHFQRTRNAQGSSSGEGAEGQPRARDQKG